MNHNNNNNYNNIISKNNNSNFKNLYHNNRINTNDNNINNMVTQQIPTTHDDVLDNRNNNKIWCTFLYGMQIKTNLIKAISSSINKHFNNKNRYHEIFNNKAIRFGCWLSNNIAVIISCINNKKLDTFYNRSKNNNINHINQNINYDCRNKSKCGLNNKCRRYNVVYKCIDSMHNTKWIYISLLRIIWTL